MEANQESGVVKEILVCFFMMRIDMLIPKVRGTGFRKVPLGHHDCPLSRMAYKIGYDLWGLDGALEIDTGHISRDAHEGLMEDVVSPIAEHLGLPWRVVSETEYWNRHPVKSAT